MSYFNVRVYGLLLNYKNELLVSDEQEYGVRFSKFPGGGLEFGEGLIDGLKREFLEECQADIEVLEHVYTTDFFEKSSFNDSQIISVYYLVREATPLNLIFKDRVFDFDSEGEVLQVFRWADLCTLDPGDLTFETDRRALKLLKNKLCN